MAEFASRWMVLVSDASVDELPCTEHGNARSGRV